MVSVYSSLVKQLSEGAELVANKPSASLSSLVEKWRSSAVARVAVAAVQQSGILIGADLMWPH